MGAECRQINHQQQQFSFIQPLSHPAFGNIFYLRCDRSKVEKAVKQVPCPNESVLNALRKRVQFARQCDNNMTLVQIYDYDIIDKHSQEVALWEALQPQSQFSCKANKNQPFVLIHFQYFPPESCLSQIFKSRRSQLDKLIVKYGKGIMRDTKSVQMWNYSQIDKLSSHQRQVINIFYQEIQVIRMIDHIIGAVYFLHHFDVPHSALRPQQILVDQDGRFVLVDRQVFIRKSNYQLALQLLTSKQRNNNNANDQVLSYFCPEYIPYLKNRSPEPQVNQEKADIFCVGLLALTMCLLDQHEQIFEYSSYQRNIKMNEGQLTKRLVRMKQKYSQPFADLVQKMVKKDPKQRIDFAQLIDQLNPLLQWNLQGIKRVHSMDVKDEVALQPQLEQTYQYGGRLEQEQLKGRLISMQRQFQKVMNNRLLLFCRNTDECDLRGEENKLLQKLQKIKTAREQISSKGQNCKRSIISINKQQDKRYISGKQLEEIVWKQYQNIKSRRQGEK